MNIALTLGMSLIISCSGSKTTGKNSGGERIDSGMADENSPLMALCNSIDYSDTTRLHDAAVMTDYMVRLVKLLPLSDSLSLRNGVIRFFTGIRHDERSVIMADSLVNLYLDNPASPVRNEELYIRFLNAMLSVDSLPEATRLRGEDKLQTALLNRPGTVANDFTYIERHGSRGSLHSLNSDRIMLVFYDPECPHCGDILSTLANDERVNQAVSSGEMTVIAVYAEGKRDVWERTKNDMPDNWLVGYDMTGVLDNDLYSLPAMPVVYLLDSEKRVILKDPVIQVD